MKQRLLRALSIALIACGLVTASGITATAASTAPVIRCC